MKLRIETAVPCVEYDDFLRITLPNNRVVLSSITVLTAPWDTRTAEIATKYGAKVLVTDSWKRGGPFNKAGALNEWLERVASPSEVETWALVLDADILLPRDRPLTIDQLDPQGLHSARRRMCYDYNSFRQFAAGQRPWETFPINVPPVRNGRVWGHRPTSNPAGLQGYMQLWCPSRASGMKRFPETGTAAKYDVEFALSFAQSKRTFIQQYDVLHLGPPQVNWPGRISPPWGASSDRCESAEVSKFQ